MPRYDKQENDLSKANFICKIILENSKSINGFFCKIPYETNYISVLISTSQILNKTHLKENKIKYFINNKTEEREYKTLNVNNKRKVYINDNLDISIIEINQKDNIYNFFELDNDILKENFNNEDLFKTENFYTIYYPKNSNILKYLNISETILNQNKIKEELLGSPILSANLTKIVGIINDNFIYNYNFSSSIKEFILQYNNNDKKEKLNELTIRYDISDTVYEIKIFDDLFVTNNKSNCKLIIDGKEKELCEYIAKNDIEKEISSNSKFLEIKLIETKKITNMKSMFFGCTKLISLPNFSNWDTKNIRDMSFMFYDCSSLENLPDISNWDTSDLTSMLGMFKGCSSLENLPDISKWDTSKVCNMSCMFFDCSSLLSLPDISKWNTSRLILIEGMFYDCKSLSYIPDISKWDTRNITSFSYMFYGCESLVSLPDISKWKTGYVKNICSMFEECKSLAFLPDFTQWTFSDVVFVNGVFKRCLSVISFPNISKFNFRNDKYKKCNLVMDNKNNFDEYEEDKGNKKEIDAIYNNLSSSYKLRNRNYLLKFLMILFCFVIFFLLNKIYNFIILNKTI